MDSDAAVRIVLMHPPLANVLAAATPDYIDDNRGDYPPLGLLYLQAALENSRHESIFLDANLEKWSHEEAARQALSHAPDVIGLQAMTFTLKDACLVARAVKQLRQEVKILIGGPHPTVFPEETAALDDVDFAFAGEAETLLIRFLDCFHDYEARASVPGIACKQNGRIVFAERAPLIENLDSIPFPARQSSSFHKYTSVLAERNPITTMITSRGCPYSCIFCNRMGRTYRTHSASYVLDEMDHIAQLGIREIFIHDDTFTLKRERVRDICNGMIDRNYDLVWAARTRVDCVDAEILSLMKRAGCRRLSFGVESGSEGVLKSMKKNTNLKQVEEVFSSCRKQGIITLADFMFGNKDEQIEDVEKTIRLMRKIKPDYAQFSICSPYPATPLYSLALENGIVSEDVWLKYAKNPFHSFETPYWTQHFSRKELDSLVAKAYTSFYLQPVKIFTYLRKLKSVSQFRIMIRAGFRMLFRFVFS